MGYGLQGLHRLSTTLVLMNNRVSAMFLEPKKKQKNGFSSESSIKMGIFRTEGLFEFFPSEGP